MLFERSIELPASIDACFAFHERPGALQRLIPPWESVSIQRSDNSLEPGSEVLLRSRILGMNLRWLARHEILNRPHLFVDNQVSGPFASWRHEHRFESLGPNRTKLVDHIDYELPYGKLGAAMGSSFIEQKLNAMFDYRHRVTTQDLEFATTIATANSESMSPKRIAVTGSHGLIGSLVVAILSTLGHHVVIVERLSKKKTESATRATVANSVQWDPQNGLESPEQLDGLDAFIHLAGQGIGDHRWSKAVKAELTRSRVEATRVLSQQLSMLPRPPKVFVSASGVGIYGERGDDYLEETEPSSSDFLGKLAMNWEGASKPLKDCGTRVCSGRLGVVLTPKGGALAKMLPLFRFGLGGRLGSGKQYWSWIGHDDAACGFVWLALNPTCSGPYNFVAGSVTNAFFTKQLAATLKRLAILPVPKIALRMAMGEMADALLLNSTRAVGKRLLASGYPMRQIDLTEAFRQLLGVQEM